MFCPVRLFLLSYLWLWTLERALAVRFYVEYLFSRYYLHVTRVVDLTNSYMPFFNFISNCWNLIGALVLRAIWGIKATSFPVCGSSLYGLTIFSFVLWLERLPCIGSSTGPVSHLWAYVLFIHAACSSLNRIGDIPLLDRREMRIFVVSDPGSGGEIGIGVNLIIKLLTLMRTRHRLFLVQHMGSRVEFGM